MSFTATVLIPPLDSTDSADDDVVSRKFSFSVDGGAPTVETIPVDQLQRDIFGELNQTCHVELTQLDAAGNESPARTLDFTFFVPDVTPPPVPGELSVTIVENP